ncbi:hypothetical protein [Saccharopolyspora pogona]|uniref:hypothetical protein n=1 Tax=Saccharopolyspora pogona TaxID=333966 RepID=UPI0016894AE7|nr:hypothetical protein [Saccharopolyspora pogona]
MAEHPLQPPAEVGSSPSVGGMVATNTVPDDRSRGLSAALKRRFDPDGIPGWSLATPDRVSR